MNKKSILEIAITALGMHWENKSTLKIMGYVPYGEKEFFKLADEAAEAWNEAIKELKKVSPPYPPFKENNNIYIKTKNKIRSGVTELEAAQKSKRTKMPHDFFNMASEGNVPEPFRNYAEEKKIQPSMVAHIFNDFVLYHSSRDKKYANWLAVWQTWVRNAIKWHPEYCAQKTSYEKLDGGKIEN